jgi:hypothetical protein
MQADMKARSHTFHGRDIFAPVAAQLFMGRLRDLKPAQTYVELELTEPQWSDQAVSGTIVYVDRYGNCITNIPGEVFVQRSGYGSTHLLNGAVPIRFVQTYDEVIERRPLLTIGSFESVEIAVNKGNAAQQLNLKLGDFVTLNRS